MKIVNLVENTAGASSCGMAHGLCFYVETKKHRLLIDSGPSGDLLLSNAEKKGVDLTKVDLVFLSHGHYDHGGGLAAFYGINPDAKIYAQKGADGAFYAFREDGEAHYIGLPDEVKALPGIVWIEGDEVIDEEITLISGLAGDRLMPPGNAHIRMMKDGALGQDSFSHEMCVAVTENGQTALFSGCAHSGILNILHRYREVCGGEPDYVFSGFHMRKHTGFTDDDIRVILETAQELKEYADTKFYTCHCTGIGPYEVMKRVMGSRLSYIHCGEELVIAPKKHSGRKNYMKQHRFFAWATVFCFVMTMVTGYRRK